MGEMSIIDEVADTLCEARYSGVKMQARLAISTFIRALNNRGFRVVSAELSGAQYDAISGLDKMWREMNSGEVYRVAVGAAPEVDLEAG
jgi:hypothetical protein